MILFYAEYETAHDRDGEKRLWVWNKETRCVGRIDIVWIRMVNCVSEGETRAVWRGLNNRTEQSKPKEKEMSEMRDGVE